MDDVGDGGGIAGVGLDEYGAGGTVVGVYGFLGGFAVEVGGWHCTMNLGASHTHSNRDVLGG